MKYVISCTLLLASCSPIKVEIVEHQEPKDAAALAPLATMPSCSANYEGVRWTTWQPPKPGANGIPFRSALGPSDPPEKWYLCAKKYEWIEVPMPKSSELIK